MLALGCAVDIRSKVEERCVLDNLETSGHTGQALYSLLLGTATLALWGPYEGQGCQVAVQAQLACCGPCIHSLGVSKAGMNAGALCMRALEGTVIA